MAGTGRIRDEDIAAVRDRINIEDIVGRYVTLKKSGTSLKGLCPFHDEKGPSFHVTPAKGYFHCFGCDVGGDVISFVQKIEHLKFFEAVEHLAQEAGVELRYEGADANGPTPAERAAARSQRQRLVDAHIAAADFYTAQLMSPGADVARRFLAERGFDQNAALTFGCGYSPDSWDALTNHLRGKGFTSDDLIASGLSLEGRRGPVDRFRGRLMWPIRDLTGEIVGFGARKLHDHDDGPKYLNTSETILYKKSRVLFGLDLARKDIAKTQKAVVVEGYTDVMACHLSGITTAVATCGTAFGEEHIRVLRRLLSDESSTGEVVFTFDGDAAGQKAALRAFDFDDKFQAHTSVAVADAGMDPCELRLSQGPTAVQALIDSRQPLFTFAIRTALTQHDTTSPEGRVAALRATAPMVAKVRSHDLRRQYTGLLARWIGLEYQEVADTVAGGPQRATTPTGSTSTPVNAVTAVREREILKVVLQLPLADLTVLDSVRPTMFHIPEHQTLWANISKIMLSRDINLVDALRTQHPDLDNALTSLAVEPLHEADKPAEEHVLWFAVKTLTEDIARNDLATQDTDLPYEEQDRLALERVDLQARLRTAQQRYRALGINQPR